MTKLYNSLITVLFLMVITFACDDTIVNDIPLPEENLSYSQHIQPLFNNYCNNTACHNAEDNAGGMT